MYKQILQNRKLLESKKYEQVQKQHKTNTNTNTSSRAARGPPFIGASPPLRPRERVARGVVREVREKARAVERARTLVVENHACHILPFQPIL